MLMSITFGFILPVCLFMFWMGALILINSARNKAIRKNFEDDI